MDWVVGQIKMRSPFQRPTQSKRLLSKGQIGHSKESALKIRKSPYARARSLVKVK